MYQLMSQRGECEGVTRGATEGQRIGRKESEGKDKSEGKTVEVESTEPEIEGTRGNKLHDKQGAEEALPIPIEQPPCACVTANCVYTVGGWWPVKREGVGGRGETTSRQGTVDPTWGICKT